jgi:hypothetical protein
MGFDRRGSLRGGSCSPHLVEYGTYWVYGVGWGLRGVLARRRNGGEEGVRGKTEPILPMRRVGQSLTAHTHCQADRVVRT